MKIGLYTPYLDTLAGGEKYMLSIASCLAKDHTVSIFWDDIHENEFRNDIKEKFNIDLSAVDFVENIFTAKTSFFSRWKKSQQYDAIILLSDGSIPVVSSKLILHFQTPMPWIHPTLKTRMKLQKVSHIVCNSLYTKKFIDKEFGIKSDVIYPPVVIEKKDDPKENIILHVGRYGITNEGSSAKKQEFMIETFKNMVDDGLKEWKCIFVVSYKKDAKDALDQLKNTTKGYPIEFIENPQSNVLWTMYNKAKIYWHASGFGEDLEKNPGMAEHFGISTVEAMGCGAVPVVISAGGQIEIVTDGENGLLWNTQEELVDKTKQVIEDSKLWQKLSDAAKKRATDFSFDRFSIQWQKLLV